MENSEEIRNLGNKLDFGSHIQASHTHSHMNHSRERIRRTKDMLSVSRNYSLIKIGVLQEIYKKSYA